MGTHLPANTRIAAITATSRTLAVPRIADGRTNSYKKLLAQLQSHFSELGTTDAQRYIDMLRSENNGKLSGLVMQTIYDRVGQFMSADRNKRMMENECSICLEDMTDRDSRMLKPCGHKFHNQCINVKRKHFVFKRN